MRCASFPSVGAENEENFHPNIKKNTNIGIFQDRNFSISLRESAKMLSNRFLLDQRVSDGARNEKTKREIDGKLK